MTVGAKLALLSAAGAAACGGVPSAQPPAAVEETTLPTIVPFADAQWDQLNPARGDLWGAPDGGGSNGSLLKLPGGFDGIFRGPAHGFRAVVISGNPALRAAGPSTPAALSPGSYLSSDKPSAHRLSCGPGDACVIYVRAKGRVLVTAGD